MARGVARVPEPREYVLTRRCTRCGQTKPWAEFPPAARNADGSVRFPYPSCHACVRERARENHARRPEVQRAWREKNRERVREQQRETRARRTEAQRELDRERERIYNARYRERHLERIRERERERSRRRREELSRDRRGDGGRLPVGPLRDWLEEYFATGEESITEFCERVGIGDRSLRRVLSEHENVTMDLADRILIANGVLLSELYPLDEQEAA